MERTQETDVDALEIYLAEIRQIPLLTQDEWHRLNKQVTSRSTQTSQQARKTIVEHNLRLVLPIAQKFRWLMPYLDAVQYGNKGLMHAATKYNPNINPVFSTYAVPWIHNEIDRAVRVEYGMGVTESDSEMAKKLTKIRRSLAIGGEVHEHLELASAAGITLRHFSELSRFISVPDDIDRPLQPDEGGHDTLGDIMPESADLPERVHDIKSLENRLRHLVENTSGLSYDERVIILNKLGLISFNPGGNVDTDVRLGKMTDRERRRVKNITYDWISQHMNELQKLLK